LRERNGIGWPLAVCGKDIITIKIVESNRCLAVVTGLNRRMNHRNRLNFLQQVKKPFTITSFLLVMIQARNGSLQTLLIPAGILRWGKKYGLFIVIEPLDLLAETCEL
jgi:hypothetical protein